MSTWKSQGVTPVRQLQLPRRASSEHDGEAGVAGVFSPYTNDIGLQSTLVCGVSWLLWCSFAAKDSNQLSSPWFTVSACITRFRIGHFLSRILKKDTA